LEVISTTDALREQLGEWRQAGDHIALVPTMGNLHAGQLSLVNLARTHAERVVVSIFINPELFDAEDEFDNYPRTLERDKRQLDRINTDLLFIPDLHTMYPFGIDAATSVSVPVLTDELCGSVRPGHFDSITTVMSRLFSLVQPDVAIFGQKNYQQYRIIRRLVDDLSLPIGIVCGPTEREKDGLARSSRNQFLSEEERARAPALFEILERVAADLLSGKREFAELESAASAELAARGLEPEYVSIRRADSLAMPDPDTHELVVLGAARLGKVRLIDNVAITV